MEHAKMRTAENGAVVVDLDATAAERFTDEIGKTWHPQFVTFTYDGPFGTLAVITADRVIAGGRVTATRGAFQVQESNPRADLFPWLGDLFDVYRPLTPRPAPPTRTTPKEPQR